MRNLLYIVIMLVVSGCGFASSQQPRVLDEAGRLMASDPQAALSKLNSVDVSQFADSATMARWALLYSEALVANRITAPTDTIVDIAIDYYGRHDCRDEYIRASRLKALIKRGDAGYDALASALYLQKEKEFMLYKERTTRRQHMCLSLILLLVAAGVIVWMLQRLKLQAARSEALMAEASGLKGMLEVSRGDVGRLQDKLHGLLDNRFELIDSLCQTYYESQGTKTERKAIVDRVKAAIESVRTDSLQRMEQDVNACRGNLLARVCECCPDIKPADYQLLVYLASGLSTRAVCLLLGETADVVYKRKSRLKSRLKAAAAPACPDVMDIF